MTRLPRCLCGQSPPPLLSLSLPFLLLSLLPLIFLGWHLVRVQGVWQIRSLGWVHTASVLPSTMPTVTFVLRAHGIQDCQQWHWAFHINIRDSAQFLTLPTSCLVTTTSHLCWGPSTKGALLMFSETSWGLKEALFYLPTIITRPSHAHKCTHTNCIFTVYILYILCRSYNATIFYAPAVFLLL